MDTGFICTDCVMWHENRDSSGASPEWVAERLPRITDAWVIDDTEPHFSDWPCHSCGQTLAGDRYSAFRAAR